MKSHSFYVTLLKHKAAMTKQRLEIHEQYKCEIERLRAALKAAERERDKITEMHTRLGKSSRDRITELTDILRGLAPFADKLREISTQEKTIIAIDAINIPLDGDDK